MHLRPNINKDLRLRQHISWAYSAVILGQLTFTWLS